MFSEKEFKGLVPVMPDDFGARASEFWGYVEEKLQVRDVAEIRSLRAASGCEIGKREVNAEGRLLAWIHQVAPDLAIQRASVRPDRKVEIHRLVGPVEVHADPVIAGSQIQRHGRRESVPDS
jgi:hypothetical protein